MAHKIDIRPKISKIVGSCGPIVTGKEGKRITMTIREVIRSGTSVSVCKNEKRDRGHEKGK